jgi:hypothetical protein
VNACGSSTTCSEQVGGTLGAHSRTLAQGTEYASTVAIGRVEHACCILFSRFGDSVRRKPSGLQNGGHGDQPYREPLGSRTGASCRARSGLRDGQRGRLHLVQGSLAGVRSSGKACAWPARHAPHHWTTIRRSRHAASHSHQSDMARGVPGQRHVGLRTDVSKTRLLVGLSRVERTRLTFRLSVRTPVGS